MLRITVTSGTDLLAMLFYLADGAIVGATRLQKIVFLVQQEFGLGNFKFTASKYGPWSRELEELIQKLVDLGEINVEELKQEELQERPARVFRASKTFLERGKEVFRRLFEQSPGLALVLRTRVRIYVSMPITYLLAYVYRKYPEYTVQSIIRERVEEWQKYYGL